MIQDFFYLNRCSVSDGIIASANLFRYVSKCAIQLAFAYHVISKNFLLKKNKKNSNRTQNYAKHRTDNLSNRK